MSNELHVDNLVCVGFPLKVIELISDKPYPPSSNNRGTLYVPEDISEVRERARKAGRRFFKVFGTGDLRI